MLGNTLQAQLGQPQQLPAMQAPGVGQGPGLDLMGALGLILGQRNQQQMNLLDFMSQSNIGQAVRGERPGQGLGDPATTGLAGFYADNPHMRQGEFDPTGQAANARRTANYRQADSAQMQQAAMDAMQRRLDMAKMLAEYEKLQGQQGPLGAMAGPDFNPWAGF